MLKRIIAVVALVIVLGGTATAQISCPAYDRAVVAYDAGDYTTALSLLRPCAEQGSADAQYNLGIMYANGDGVGRDRVRAYMWYLIASSTGDDRALTYREELARLMTPAQIAEAQRLAREWLAAHPPQ